MRVLISYYLITMNPNEMTQKTLEALQSAVELAVENHNPSLEPVHLLISLSNQTDTAMVGVLAALDVTDSLIVSLNKELERLPQNTDTQDE